MRILFATDSYHPNIDGGAVAQRRLVNELKKKGHDVAVLTPNSAFKKKVERDNGTYIYRTRGLTLPFYMDNRYHFSLFPLVETRGVIKKFKPEIVNICSPYPNSICALIWAKKIKIPVVGSIHILPENMLTPFVNMRLYNNMYVYSWRYLVYFFNMVDWATIPTKTGAELYKKKGLKTPITPISNGVDTHAFKPNREGGYLKEKIGLPEKKVVLYTGRINPEKNLDVLVKAIPYVVKKIDAHFLFCGSGGTYKRKIIGLTKKLGVSDNTTFIDFLEWEDYKNVYSLADLFVMPAESELQSIVTMEAIASGLPVVVVNKGAVPELTSCDNGFVFEPKNSPELADRIIKILTDEKLRKKMSENSLKLIKKHSMEHVVSEYEKIYEKITQIKR